MRNQAGVPSNHGPSPGRPIYSVLITSRNEGVKLRKTVDSVLSHSPLDQIEIVIIDDASTDGSVAFTSNDYYLSKPIRVVHNKGRRGLIYSRAKAADLANGEYLAFLDAHCAVSSNWLEEMAEELVGIGGRGLVSPTVCELDTDSWSIDDHSVGYTGCTISSPFLDFSWTSPSKIDGRVCTCTIGGMAWMCTRDWYQHIGGLDSGMVIWGLENIDIPVRTWAAGGWCVVKDSVKIGHLDKVVPLIRLNDVNYMYNKIRAAHNMFTAETFKKVMGTLAYLSGYREALTRVHTERESMAPFKDQFESIRMRSDDWLIDTFKLPLLESPTYHVAPRRPNRGVSKLIVTRPSVSLILPVRARTRDVESRLAALFQNRTFGNIDVLLAVDEQPDASPPFSLDEPWRSHPRVHVISCPSTPTTCLEHEMAKLSEADFLVFLSENIVELSQYWLEEFLLIAEKHPRMLMVCPKTRPQIGSDAGHDSDFFETVWDWQTPGFFRKRMGQPLVTAPYQVLSCPDHTVLFANRRAVVELGGNSKNG